MGKRAPSLHAKTYSLLQLVLNTQPRTKAHGAKYCSLAINTQVQQEESAPEPPLIPGQKPQIEHA